MEARNSSFSGASVSAQSSLRRSTSGRVGSSRSSSGQGTSPARSSGAAAPWANFRKPDFQNWKQSAGFGFAGNGFSGSGNAAFDAYKREQMKRLDEERRKLEDEQKAFRDFVEKVRRAKDQDEFDRFMTERNAPASPDKPSTPEAPQL